MLKHLFSLFILLICLPLAGCSDNTKNEITLQELPANDYPDRAVSLIVPFSPGGGSDLQARSLEPLARRHLNQPLIVFNQTGGGGIAGWNELVQARPDGYTLGISSIDLILHSLYNNTDYHYITALDPIAQLTSSPSVMLVNANQPWQTVAEVLHRAKREPDRLKLGSAGVGSLPHILGAVLAQSAGIQFEHIPYNGGAEAMAALLNDTVQIVFANPAVAKKHLASGKVRALAVTSASRLHDPALNHIPTFTEQHIDIVLENWKGVAAPKIMPRRAKKRLAAAFKTITADPEFAQRMNDLGLTPAYLAPHEAQRRWSADCRRLEQWLTATGILEQMKKHKPADTQQPPFLSYVTLQQTN